MFILRLFLTEISYVLFKFNIRCVLGADDSIFIQINTETAQQQKNTSHNCGVTSMHSNAGREYTFATGSYDEFVHIWDTRMLKAPRDSAKMPGPVWRVKWHPVNHNRLITACMAEGVSIVEFEETKPIRFLSNFKEHNDIAYGVDWYHGQDANLIASCSFYNHLLCISTY